MSFLGRAPEALTYAERRKVAGHWIALERYTPATMPLRLIRAMGASKIECLSDLQRQGLDASSYELEPLPPWK